MIKLTALIEYLDLLQNFHERNFHMLAYEIYFTNENKAIKVVLLISVHC